MTRKVDLSRGIGDYQAPRESNDDYAGLVDQEDEEPEWETSSSGGSNQGKLMKEAPSDIRDLYDTVKQFFIQVRRGENGSVDAGDVPKNLVKAVNKHHSTLMHFLLRVDEATSMGNGKPEVRAAMQGVAQQVRDLVMLSQTVQLARIRSQTKPRE